MGYVVEARDLVKRFGSLTAVDHVSFQMGGGECVGFLGPNGAGKTTILRTLYGLARLTSGELSILGFRVPEQMREIKRRIGVVPQETTLDVDLTVMQNLAVYARYFDIPTETARERADELVSRFRLEEKANANLGSLSGGMKRRLLIARALINRPDLLILDEPTTGLDAQSRHLVWSHLEAQRSNGLAILLTTQHMEEAERLCGRILVIDSGRVIAEGSPQSLVREARVANLEQLFLKLTGTELRD
ncbi:MAG TPA: ABC transporter ATP-binding protein [Myxococcota bacterium]|nr:ABC transporter ATP-binding protein [Myxococcota bacterium]